MNTFLGVDCQDVTLGDFHLSLSKSIGPRVLALEFRSSGNIFAELPDVSLDYLDRGKFTFYGGHRLWVAPENPAVTYIPDDHPIQIRPTDDGVELVQDVEPLTGLQKSIRLRSTPYADVIIVDHRIKNEGSLSPKVAPWAITQMKLGGTAILPVKATTLESALLPDRSLVLWPYTDLYDERLAIGSRFLMVKSSLRSEHALKVGVSNQQQWMAYFIDHFLFIKYAQRAENGSSLDFGAEGQCYCNQRFLELETLGSYGVLRPGESVGHREVWRMVEAPFPSLDEENLSAFMNSDQMAAICQGMI